MVIYSSGQSVKVVFLLRQDKFKVKSFDISILETIVFDYDYKEKEINSVRKSIYDQSVIGSQEVSLLSLLGFIIYL